MNQLPWILGVFIIGAILGTIAVAMDLRQQGQMNDYPTLRTLVNDARAKAQIQGASISFLPGTKTVAQVTPLNGGTTTTYSFRDQVIVNGQTAGASITVNADGTATLSGSTATSISVAVGGTGATCTISLVPLALVPTGACAPH